MLDEQEKQKKTLLYLGIAVIIVTLLTIIGSFFTKSETPNGTQNNGQYVFLEVQEDQIEQFISSYMNSKERFYENSITTAAQLTDAQKQFISLFLIKEFSLYEDSNIKNDGSGCQQLVYDMENYNAILENYFGASDPAPRKNSAVDISNIMNYKPVQFTYDPNMNTMLISGDYICSKEYSLLPTSQYVIYNLEYQQKENTITALVRYYYRKKVGQTTNYTDYQYKFNKENESALFTLNFETGRQDYVKDIVQEKNMISNYADQLAGLKFTFELRDDSYVQFKQVETVEPEVK